MCGARAYDCRCGLDKDHGPGRPHRCGIAGCLATWTGDPERSTFQAVTLPTWPRLPPASRPVLRLVS